MAILQKPRQVGKIFLVSERNWNPLQVELSKQEEQLCNILQQLCAWRDSAQRGGVGGWGSVSSGVRWARKTRRRVGKKLGIFLQLGPVS